MIMFLLQKSPKIIEYSPKKKNVVDLQGTVDIWRHITVKQLADSMNRSIGKQ